MKSCLILLATFLLISNEAHSCFISSFETIIKSDNISLDKSIIIESDCEQDVQEKFITFANENSGEISSRPLNIYFEKKITLKPEVINILDMNQFIKERLSDKDYNIEEAKIIGNKKALLIENQKSLEFECKNCNNLGNVNFKISHAGNTTWGTAIVKEGTEALVANTNLSYTNNTLFPAQFEKKKIYTTTPEQVFKNFKQISFYKLNKNIRSGHIIQTNDLTSAFLVKIGQPVNVIYQSAGITLSYPAKALRSGRIGEVVQLEGRNKKKIFATVTGFNKAKLEL